MEYIDVDKLKAEIDKLIDDAPSYDDSKAYLLKVCSIIDSLQQEQPEVDLEKEIKDKYSLDTTTLKTRAQYAKLARHFYELGLNARKEE